MPAVTASLWLFVVGQAAAAACPRQYCVAPSIPQIRTVTVVVASTVTVTTPLLQAHSEPHSKRVTCKARPERCARRSWPTTELAKPSTMMVHGVGSHGMNGCLHSTMGPCYCPSGTGSGQGCSVIGWRVRESSPMGTPRRGNPGNCRSRIGQSPQLATTTVLHPHSRTIA